MSRSPISTIIMMTGSMAALGMPASEEETIDKIKALLAEGHGVNDRDDQGATPLIYAAANGCAAIATFLIEQGADIDARTTAGQNAADVALLNDNKGVLSVLDAARPSVSPDTLRRRGSTSVAASRLYDALLHRESEAVEDILAHLDDVDVTSPSWAKPLDMAIITGDTRTVKKLLEKGLPADIRDEYGDPPLLRAAMNGRKEIAEMLLDRGAKVEGDVPDWDTPMQQAIYGGRFQDRREDRDDCTALMDLFYARGARFDTPPRRRTFLTFAIIWDSPAAARHLVEKYHMDVNEADSSGQTPLICAVRGGDENLAAWLIQKGAKVNVKDRFGRTALSHAANQGRVPMLKLLLDNGANIDTRDKAGLTPLWHAVLHRRADAVDYLIARGADPAIQDGEGRSLSVVARAQNMNGISESLDKGLSAIAAARAEVARGAAQMRQMWKDSASRSAARTQQEQLRKKAPRFKPKGPR